MGVDAEDMIAVSPAVAGTIQSSNQTPQESQSSTSSIVDESVADIESLSTRSAVHSDARVSENSNPTMKGLRRESSTGLTRRFSSDKFLVPGEWSRRAKGCFCCGFATTVLVGVALALLWPRNPTWSVQHVSIDQKVVDGLITSFTNPNFNGTMVMPVNVLVDMHNPNFVGASVSNGHFVITHGEHVLATAVLQPVQLNARSSGLGIANATSIVTSEVSKSMMEEVLPDFKMKVAVDGQIDAKVDSLGGFSLTVQVNCDVDVDVLQLVQDPNLLITGHACVYTLA